jgi:SAM-dependent methyltransferase
MNDAEFAIYSSIEDSHWWFVGKRLLLAALLEGVPRRERILDLGCGSGGVLQEWSSVATCVGSDVSAYALEICRERGIPHLVRSDLSAVPFCSESFDVVMALDVIEHLDDDVALLRKMGALCSTGGRCIVAVPAYTFLWSQHDETFGHKRRYTAKRLEAAIREAGLIPERITYTNFFALPPAALWRVVSRVLGLGKGGARHDFFSLPAPLNRAVSALYRLEATLLRHMNLPMGVSVVCVARTR